MASGHMPRHSLAGSPVPPSSRRGGGPGAERSREQDAAFPRPSSPGPGHGKGRVSSRVMLPQCGLGALHPAGILGVSGPILAPLPKSRGFVGAGRTPYVSLQHLRARAAWRSLAPLPHILSRAQRARGSCREAAEGRMPALGESRENPAGRGGSPSSWGLSLCTPLSNSGDRLPATL